MAMTDRGNGTSSALPKNVNVDRGDVERTVASILTSPQFAGSPQLDQFLNYIVARTLDGEEDAVKAYSIGVDALGRGEDFDPQTNATVRVAAGRLRQALALYNASAAASNDPVEIDLQPGSYVPRFSARETKALASASDVSAPAMSEGGKSAGLRRFGWLGIGLLAVLAAGALFVLYGSGGLSGAAPAPLSAEDANRKPSIATTLRLPEDGYPEWFKADEFADAIQVVLTRFDDYRHTGIGYQDGALPVVPAVPASNADYQFIHGVYARGDEVRVFSSLIRGVDGETMWAKRQTFAKPGPLENRDVEDLVGRIFAALGSPYGLIYADLATAENSRQGLACIVSTFRYFYRESRAAHRDARACAEELVAAGTRLPGVYAALTFLYLDEHREGFNRRARDPLMAARKMATRAVEYAPLSARAHQAMFAVHKVQGRHDPAQRAARRALDLNPYDTDILGDFASYLIGQGRLAEARGLFAKLDGMLQIEPAWLIFARFSLAFQDGDLDAAGRIMADVDFRRAPLLAFATVLMARDRASDGRAVKAYRHLRRSEPRLANAPQLDLMTRGFDQRVSARLATAFQTARKRILPALL